MKTNTQQDSSLGPVRTAWIAIACAAVAVLLTQRGASAGPGPQSIDSPALKQSAAEVQAYWTAERMQSAIPMDLMGVAPPAAVQQQGAERAWPADAVPGHAPGWAPGSGPQPLANASVVMGGAQPQTSPPFTPPANPTDFDNYAPFQRFSLPMRYMTYPFSTIGKLFFMQNGLNYVCSASVIGRNTIATAGHCVHDGSNSTAGWSSNFLFCPSYNAGGVNPARGCWGWSFATTSSQWFSSGAFDRDYACIVTAPTGSVLASPVGDVTGWAGRAWNWSSKQAEFAFGYPSGAPFGGSIIIADASTEWYEVNMTAGDGQMSKYIGNDMTGGSSGGPWWLNLAHQSAEVADTDGSGITDPGQGACCPFINGVNSHKRCNAGGCPTGSIFTQEMGSPQFMSTDGDINESEDVFANCFNNGGT